MALRRTTRACYGNFRAVREGSNGRCDLLRRARVQEAEDDGGDIVACDPKEARSADQAIRMAASLAVEEGHCGAIAFSRTGDPALGDFEDALILKTLVRLMSDY
jgi:hypothetical protein